MHQAGLQRKEGKQGQEREGMGEEGGTASWRKPVVRIMGDGRVCMGQEAREGL